MTTQKNGKGNYWQKAQKKTIYVLNINEYAPQITALTYPLIKHYAEKIGANFFEIKERKFPDFAPVYEKLQIYQLAQEHENDWSIYIDSDALVHPDFFDITEHLPKDTVCHHGRDMATHRWVYDRFFKRDGRHIGSCNWFTVGSDWCIELWKPLQDITYEQALKNIFPTVNELNTVITPDHLIDDYTLSRNIAMHGLKFTTIIEICRKLGFESANLFWHQYTIDMDKKVAEMKKVIVAWGLAKQI